MNDPKQVDSCSLTDFDRFAACPDRIVNPVVESLISQRHREVKEEKR